MMDFFFEGGLFGSRFGNIVLVIIVLLGVQYVAKRAIGHVVDRAVRGHKYHSPAEEKQRKETLVSLFRTTVVVVVWIVGVFSVLGIFGVNLAALATGAGLIGIVIGFGVQSTVKDFLSGIFIILENQYGIGDVVTIGGHSGLVEQVTLRMTKLRDLDNSVFFVPNGEISTVKNMTFDYSGVLLDIGVGYDTDINEVMKIINSLGEEQAKDPEWKDRILEPITFLRLDNFGDSSVILKAVGKVTPIEQWNVAGDYRERLKKAFEKHGIDIPYPQRVIHQPKEKTHRK